MSKKKTSRKVEVSSKKAGSAKKRMPRKTSTGLSARLSRHKWLIVVLLLLAAMWLQMYAMARGKSATMDEQNHITRGLVLLRTGDLRLGRLHPPLINIISALPLALDKAIELPLDDPSWENRNLDLFADQLIWQRNAASSQSIIFRARVPIMVLAMLLGVLVFAWGSELYGKAAGACAFALVAFDPNILAHGSLATNDLGVAFFATLSLYTFWRWLRLPSWRRALIASVAFGAALLSKFSALFLIPSLILILVAHWLLTPRELRPEVKLARLVAWFAGIAFAAAVIVWALYGFKVGHTKALGFSIPAPAYVRELIALTRRFEHGNQAFLFGSYSENGWWYYFPVVLAVKTPIPTLAMIAGSLIYAWRRKTWKTSFALLIPAAIYLVLAVVSPLNIGYRHLLPAIVIMLIIAGQLASALPARRSKLAWGIPVMIGWLMVECLAVLPNHLAYFNELVGGPANGYKVLVDSNLDWGQDLIGLREYMDREKIESIKLSYFGSADPRDYGIKFDWLPGYPNYIHRRVHVERFQNPEPGVYAISATNLQGAVFRGLSGKLQGFDPHDLFAWFRERTPDAVIGHSIFVYRVK